MTLKIGITGGIGSGKTTVCRIFGLLGIPVFHADERAKFLVDTNEKIRNGLIHLFGKEIYIPGNGVDRKKLAEIIFNDKIELQKVNNIVHPEVRIDFQNWLEIQNSPYIIHEAAILFESGFYKMMDYTILISAPEEMRIKRIMKRENVDAEKVRNRIQKQWSDHEKRLLANLEIENDNSKLIIPQILNIDKNIRKNGKIW